MHEKPPRPDAQEIRRILEDVSGFSDEQLNVLTLYFAGMSHEEIAAQLCLSCTEHSRSIVKRAKPDIPNDILHTLMNGKPKSESRGRVSCNYAHNPFMTPEIASLTFHELAVLTLHFLQNRSFAYIAHALHTSREDVARLLTSVIARVPFETLEQINAMQPIERREREMTEEPGKPVPQRAPKGKAA